MSAQQREALSRGQMSTTTGSPSPSGPWPGSWPAAPWAPGATITSSGSSQPCSSQTSCIAARTASDVVAARVDHPRRDGHRGVGGLLGAADALELGAGLAAPAVDEVLRVGHELDPARAQVVGDGERERRRHERPLDPELAARPQRELVLDLRRRSAPGSSSSSRPSA